MQPPVDPVGDVVDAVGEDAIRAAVAAFYARVPRDAVLGPMYPAHDLDGAEERLRDFLIQRFGGSTRYSETRGHPRLRLRHAPFAIDTVARDRWVALMDEALAETGFPLPHRSHVQAFFAEVASFLINR